MAKVLFLYDNDQREDADVLKDCLQAQLGTSANLITAVDVLAEESTLAEALVESHCVLLINSTATSRMIQHSEQEMDDDFTTFDGRLIRQFVSREENLRKLMVVVLGEAFETEWMPEGLRVFVIGPETIERRNPVVDHMIDTIRSIVGTKPLR